MRRKAKIVFPIMWNINTFFHKNNILTTQIQQRNIFFFLAGDSIIFFLATMQNLIFFRLARALKYFYKKIPLNPR
jgi:hypothetical protein